MSGFPISLEALIERMDRRTAMDLNRLNAALEHAQALVLTFDGSVDPTLRTTLRALRDASFHERDLLRLQLAKACEPWFEVRQ